MSEIHPEQKRPSQFQSTDSSRKDRPEGFREKEKSKRIDFRSYTILIVDDENDLREAVAFDFRRKGFTVLSAKSGLGALELVKSSKVDLIISDIRMPDGDGFFLLEKIQSLEAKIPLIFITGFTDRTEAECLQKGALKVIPKPFDRKALMSSAIEALAVKR